MPAPDLIQEEALEREGESVVLEVPASGSLFVGETVQRRLDAVARALGTNAAIRCDTRRQLVQL